MKRLARRLDQAFSRRFPTAYYRLVQKPRIAFRFGPEKKLARGVQLSTSQKPSVLFFTTQKCASRYVDSILAELATGVGLIHADYDAYVAMARVPRERNPFSGAISRSFRPAGYYYGPIGTYRQIPNMDAYQVLMQLRDPRDLLTSLYYSTAFSHALISEKVIRRRKAALALTVDEFVLNGAKEYASIFEDYCAKLLPQENVLFVKYELMVSDFPAWLKLISSHLGLDGKPEILKQIEAAAEFSVETEDKYAQRRQVTPGDHLRKLKPETIAQLTEVFKPILNSLAYPE